jgi:hypothetical protein
MTLVTKASGPYTVESTRSGFVVVHRPGNLGVNSIYTYCRTQEAAEQACDEANERARLDRIREAAPVLLAALLATRALVSEASATGFNWKDGNWAERLFANQATISAAIRQAEGTP